MPAALGAAAAETGVAAAAAAEEEAPVGSGAGIVRCATGPV